MTFLVNRVTVLFSFRADMRTHAEHLYRVGNDEIIELFHLKLCQMSQGMLYSYLMI